jgi:DNA-binding transcriptional ArsR family regulator
MDTFAALAEPTRRNILEMLANSGQLSATDIYKHFHTSPQAISQHLKILRDTNLVHVEKKAQQRLYKINPEPMLELEGWIKKMTKVWDERFDRLDKVLEMEKRLLVKKKK